MSPKNLFEMQAIIKVIGVGGGGGNAVNRMVASELKGVEFIALNTDAQALDHSLADTTLVLGRHKNRGMGSGGDPAIGEESAKAEEKEITELLKDADLVFIAAGLGGGTGSGAAPLIASIAKRMGILTVGVVTKPFAFEGPKRKRIAAESLRRMEASVDTLITISNDLLLKNSDRSVTMNEAFQMADDSLRQGVQGITEIVLQAGLINVDFSDIRTVMQDGGRAVMGIGSAVGEGRAKLAAEAAMNSPLLEEPVQGAKRLLVNIRAGLDFSLGETHDAMEYLAQFTDSEEGDIFMGHVLDESLEGRVIVTALATGLSTEARPVDQAVFQTASRERTVRRPAEIPVVAAPDVSRPMELEDLDIPAFLRKYKES